jgi:PAS domain S-box-containing protein
MSNHHPPDLRAAEQTDETLKALAREAADLKAALNEHAIVSITDPEGRITYVNDKFCAISKFSRKELLGQDHRIINSDHHPKEFFRMLWDTITEGRVWHGEFRNCTKDGSFYWVAATIVPFLDENGETRQFVSIQSDITEQKRAESELAGKLRLQRLLAELSSRFVVTPSEEVDAAIGEMQRSIGETLGLDRIALWRLAENREGLIATHCWRRPPWPMIPVGFSTEGALPWGQSRILRGEIVCFSSVTDMPGEAARDIETVGSYGSKSNLTIPLLANGQVFGALNFATLGAERRWQEDEIVDLKLVAQIVGNVISRQRAEMQEEQLRSELAHAMRVAALGELAAAIAHELSQPLAAILGNAQAARRFLEADTIDLEELRAILHDIVRDDKRAGSVIHNLRTMVSKRPADREFCSLNALVREVMELINGELIAERIEIVSKLTPQSPCVEVARVELQQVLVNLLLNAVHAMESTPQGRRIIEIETRVESGAAVVAVRDFGHGIPPDRLNGIFEPFVTTRADGLGMGLSISRRIIERHHGYIEAHNREEGGAIFTFALPVPADSAK